MAAVALLHVVFVCGQAQLLRFTLHLPALFHAAFFLVAPHSTLDVGDASLELLGSSFLPPAVAVLHCYSSSMPRHSPILAL
jgi:hypothetical protein